MQVVAEQQFSKQADVCSHHSVGNADMAATLAKPHLLSGAADVYAHTPAQPSDSRTFAWSLCVLVHACASKLQLYVTKAAQCCC